MCWIFCIFHYHCINLTPAAALSQWCRWVRGGGQGGLGAWILKQINSSELQDFKTVWAKFCHQLSQPLNQHVDNVLMEANISVSQLIQMDEDGVEWPWDDWAGNGNADEGYHSWSTLWQREYANKQWDGCNHLSHGVLEMCLAWQNSVDTHFISGRFEGGK